MSLKRSKWFLICPRCFFKMIFFGMKSLLFVNLITLSSDAAKCTNYWGGIAKDNIIRSLYWLLHIKVLYFENFLKIFLINFFSMKSSLFQFHFLNMRSTCSSQVSCTLHVLYVHIPITGGSSLKTENLLHRP